MMKFTPLATLIAVVVGLLMTAAPTTVSAQTQPNITPMYFTSVTGGDEPWGRRVLLRWYTLEQLIQLDSSVIYRTDKNGVREKIATVRKTRSGAVIKNVFFKPGEERILQDAREIMLRIYGTDGANEDEFAQIVVDLLEGRDVTELATTRRNLLMQTNYGFAIVEGFGYLDFVDPANAPYTYELWAGNTSGDPMIALGRIETDAQTMVLPAPANLTEIQLLGRDGVTPARANHRRIFLDFEVPPALYEHRDINFGFNIYKLDRALEGGEDFESVSHLLTRVNDLPVMPPSPIPGEDENQSYLYADDGEWLDTQLDDDLLPVGATYTYWAVARDLLGNEGEPSNALQATVRDTFEPNTPRGMTVAPARDDNDNPVLRITFDRQDEDTDFYRIYRYQAYEHQGMPGPFPDIDGLIEGRIAEVPVPADPQVTRVTLDDPDPALVERGRVFWYAVSAVDEHGNESAISPPTRGVLDDVLPPVLDSITNICVTRVIPTVTGGVTLESSGSQEQWNPLFIIDKQHTAFSYVRIWRTRPEGRAELIHELPLRSKGFHFAEDGPDPLVTARTLIPTYLFEGVLYDGTIESVEIGPPLWSPGFARARYEVELTGRETDDNCFTGPTANDPIQIPVFPNGEFPPVKFGVDCVTDSTSMRLYRSIDGGSTYAFVREFECGSAVSVELEDHYHPDGLVRVKYSVAPVDRNGNIGLPYVLPAEFTYMADVPRPTLTDVRATGINSPAGRTFTIEWSGARQGISYYALYIAPKGDLDELATPQPPIELPLADLNNGGDFTYDNGSGLFTAVVDKPNRLATSSIASNVEYIVRVKAVPNFGQGAFATNQLPIIWETDNLGFGGGTGTLRWAPRPLPNQDTNPGLTFKHDVNVKGGSVMIAVRDENPEFPPFELIQRPFMVWKRRADLPNQPWSSVSHTIESIRRTGGVVDDPAFVKDGHTIWFADNSGHVPFVPYEYMILTLNKNTFEIDQMLGPVEYTIEIDPQ